MGKVEAIERPSREEILRIINSALSSKSMLVIFARCRVHYDGRAKSELGSGDRIIMVKPDGAFLIHQSKSGSPLTGSLPEAS